MKPLKMIKSDFNSIIMSGIFILLAVSVGFAQNTITADVKPSELIRPYKVAVSDVALKDLRQRSWQQNGQKKKLFLTNRKEYNLLN